MSQIKEVAKSEYYGECKKRMLSSSEVHSINERHMKRKAFKEVQYFTREFFLKWYYRGLLHVFIWLL